MKYVAGWMDDRWEGKRKVFETLEEVKIHFPECFSIEMTEKQMWEAVHGENGVNSEGNYFEFEFRLAFDWEVVS